MNILLDILIVIFLVLGILAGMKRGLIKTLVGVVGLVAIVIVSYTLKGYISAFLIDNLPFFNFSGELEGLTSLNILIYNVISFIVVFVIMYCILNIIMAITGFIDTLLKFTVIWIIPSKIGGAILGLLESWVYLFLVVFILAQFSVTNAYVQDSKVGNFILNHTPIVGTYLSGASNASQEIYDKIIEFREDESKTTEDLNLYILQVGINYGLISKEKATELIETGKIGLDGVMFGKGNSLWSNI